MPNAAEIAPAEPLPGAPARPFLKWVGGKRQLLGELRRRMPASFATYHEPFVGGGALFFDQRPVRAVLGDANPRLIRAYRGVRDDVEGVLARLRAHEAAHGEAHFLATREREIDGADDAEVAAWFIYLNRTAFNGLYRVNRANRFNVPFGRYARPRIVNEPLLRACSAELRRATLEVGHFEAVASRAKRGDFVYFDPPYVPLSSTASFRSYTREGFGRDEQRRLRDLALWLKRRGVHVLLSNSDTEEVRALYAAEFRVERVDAARRVSARAGGRRPVGELVIG